MKRNFILVMLLCLGIGQTISAQESRYQALFIYNFTRYIQWPSINSSEFVIGVLGKSDVYEELQKVMSDKRIGAHSVSVKKFNRSSEIGNCQVLYISGEFTAEVSQIASTATGKNVLIITERPGMARKGAGISFALEDGKQRFEISKTNVERNGLLINNQLLDMAIVRN